MEQNRETHACPPVRRETKLPNALRRSGEEEGVSDEEHAGGEDGSRLAVVERRQAGGGEGEPGDRSGGDREQHERQPRNRDARPVRARGGALRRDPKRLRATVQKRERAAEDGGMRRNSKRIDRTGG